MHPWDAASSGLSTRSRPCLQQPLFICHQRSAPPSPGARLCLGVAGCLPACLCTAKAVTPAAADNTSRVAPSPTLPAASHHTMAPIPRGPEPRITSQAPDRFIPTPPHPLLAKSFYLRQNRSRVPTVHQDRHDTSLPCALAIETLHGRCHNWVCFRAGKNETLKGELTSPGHKRALLRSNAACQTPNSRGDLRAVQLQRWGSSCHVRDGRFQVEIH